ncbi:hypothetical protein CVT24_000313 [Panaeolus cyanescens]|uniref:Uncharacterized protein n=1 Tax=Panaeolus cyanescens TaxID=181874 RepID=A0A409WSN9_9AGAR|nr:hypothetical protein CVT24_000313 [Panaeolus cyanescens]
MDHMYTFPFDEQTHRDAARLTSVANASLSPNPLVFPMGDPMPQPSLLQTDINTHISMNTLSNTVQYPIDNTFPMHQSNYGVDQLTSFNANTGYNGNNFMPMMPPTFDDFSMGFNVGASTMLNLYGQAEVPIYNAGAQSELVDDYAWVDPNYFKDWVDQHLDTPTPTPTPMPLPTTQTPIVNGRVQNGRISKPYPLPAVRQPYKAPKLKLSEVMHYSTHNNSSSPELKAMDHQKNNTASSSTTLEKLKEVETVSAHRTNTLTKPVPSISVASDHDDELEDELDFEYTSDQEPDKESPSGTGYIRCEWPRSDGKPCIKMLWVHVIPKDGKAFRGKGRKKAHNLK